MLQDTLSIVNNRPYLVKANAAGTPFAWQDIATGELFIGANVPVVGNGISGPGGGGGGGTVTSVASGAGLAGGPITTSGTLTLDLTHANTWTANQTIDATHHLFLAEMTANSLLFAGASGQVSQDNTNLFWDPTNHWVQSQNGFQCPPGSPPASGPNGASFGCQSGSGGYAQTWGGLPLRLNPLGNDVQIAAGVTVRASGTIKPVHLADGSAENDSIYFSTTASKLVYKDGSGVVNNLY